MIHHPAVLAFVVCLGACIGSFLNVVIYRVPRNLSVNKPARSFCPSCEKQIPFYYNIPILSWIMLRGKCAFCKAPISARYVVVEAVTMLFFLVIWLKFAPLLGWGVAVMLWVLISLLLAASFIDYEHQIIPDSINYGGALVAVVFAAALPLLDNRFPYLGLLHVPPGTDQLPNAIWYRGILWSVVGAGMGYLLIWSVVNLGKLAFGRKVHEYEEDQDWVIHQPNPDENPRLEIGESEHYYWEDLFNRPSDKLVIETSKVTFHLKDSETQETTVKEVKTEDFIVQNNILQAGGESIKLEGVLRIEGRTRRIVQPREAMGMGDVKFVMMIGAFLGWQSTVFSLIMGALLGSVGGIAQKRLGGQHWNHPIPFGPYLALGALLYLFCGDQIIHWYFRLGGLR